MRHLFCVENIDRCESNWPLGTKMCNFDPKIWIFGAKSQFFCYGIAIFVNRAYHQCTRGYCFSIRTTKKNSVSELWIIFQGSPRFLAILGLCHFASTGTLNFGPWSTKLGRTVRAIKKWPTMTHTWYLSFFLHKQSFWKIKFTPKFTQ